MVKITLKGRNVCITAADGHLGYLIAELILGDHEFESQVESISVLTLHPDSASITLLGEIGANIITHKPSTDSPYSVDQMIKTLKEAGCDAMCIIPPAHKNKFTITQELIVAIKEENIQNILFMSNTGGEMAERSEQPHLRDFTDLECLVMAEDKKGEKVTGQSHVIVRGGFCAENLLRYAPRAQTDGILPIPIFPPSVLAPIALSDIALMAAHILTSRAPSGFFSYKHAGQLYSTTGPKIYTGGELASVTFKTFGIPMSFQAISEREAQALLKPQGDTDPSELQYLLEYYGLVREGKCNWVATTAFEFITGVLPQNPEEFFALYAESMRGSPTSEDIQRRAEEIEANREPGYDTEGKSKGRLKRKRHLWPSEGKFVVGNMAGKWQ